MTHMLLFVRFVDCNTGLGKLNGRMALKPKFINQGRARRHQQQATRDKRREKKGSNNDNEKKKRDNKQTHNKAHHRKLLLHLNLRTIVMKIER